MEPKKFGPFLAQMRREKGMTQAQLAQALGLTVLEVLESERLPEEGPDREVQVYSATLKIASRQTNRRFRRWAAVLAVAGTIILLSNFFPVWHIAKVWEPSYFETGEVSLLAYIGSREDRRTAQKVLAQAEEVFSTLGLTWDEAQERFGPLGRYAITHPDAVEERHDLELWSARFQGSIGTMWVYYSRMGLDSGGNVVEGSYEVPALWLL